MESMNLYLAVVVVVVVVVVVDIFFFTLPQKTNENKSIFLFCPFTLGPSYVSLNVKCRLFIL